MDIADAPSLMIAGTVVVMIFDERTTQVAA